jgi:hypothetical protein
MFTIKKHSKHIIGICSLLFTIAFLYASASTKNIGTVTFNTKEDDLFSKDVLIQLTQSKKSPSILIRNLNSSNFLTVSQANPSSVLVSTMERELVKNNFTVRDRTLFDKTYSQAQGTMDYSKMSELTNTDLIMEVVGFSRVTYTTNIYMNKSNDQKTLPSPHNITSTGMQIDLKIIQVKTNEIVGTYTFYEKPCGAGCELYKYPKYHFPIYSTVGPNVANAYNLQIDDSYLNDFVSACASKFVTHLTAR